MPPTHLLFDLDGTLTDPKEGITRCIQYALAALGRDAPHADDLEWCIGPPLQQSFTLLLDSNDEGLVTQALMLYRERFAETGLYENSVYEGIPEVLSALRRQGYRLFLATAKPRIFAERILDHFDLADFFETIHGSDLNGQLTDKPSLVRYILATEGLPPDRTMIIGDRKYDIIGGKANGLQTGAVTYGYGSREELEAEAPDLLFDTPAQLLCMEP